MIRVFNFIAGLMLATFALELASMLPELAARPGTPAGPFFLLLAWAAAAAWGALMLIARADG